MPFVFAADDAFSLTINCIKPYPQTGLTDAECIFSYRLSRYRRISENTFGIWVNRFRVFYSRMCISPEKATYVTLATIALHNMLRIKSRDSYTPPGYIDELSNNAISVMGNGEITQCLPIFNQCPQHIRVEVQLLHLMLEKNSRNTSWGLAVFHGNGNICVKEKNSEKL